MKHLLMREIIADTGGGGRLRVFIGCECSGVVRLAQRGRKIDGRSLPKPSRRSGKAEVEALACQLATLA